jgi:hypothetical protein
MVFYPIRKHFPAIAEMKARMFDEKEAVDVLLAAKAEAFSQLTCF